jgi:hypothetical protein
MVSFVGMVSIGCFLTANYRYLSVQNFNSRVNILSLKNQPVKKRPSGLLKGHVDFAIKEDFKIKDEEFLHS